MSAELAADGLPPLRDVIARHGIAAKKSLGQNFLLDLNLTGRIARAAGPLEGAEVLEIGPGPGGLTRALLAGGAKRVVAVERDERCLAALEEVSARWPGRLEVHAADAMSFDPRAQFAPGAAPRIISNLPYNIGTPLLVGWISGEDWPPWWDVAALMFQKEVAERIVAAPGSGAYGRLGVLAGWRTEARIAFEVPASAFTPPPKVTSAVVRLRPAKPVADAPARALETVTAAAFGQRRKMLRQSLKPLGDAARLLDAAGIDGTRRAETLSPAEFCALARAL